MAHKITILTMPGSPDSLKRDVNIVFTLIPTGSSGPLYKPVAFAAMTFSSHSESTQTFSWENEIVFATYETKAHNGQKKCMLRTDRSPVVPVGQQTIVRGNTFAWAAPFQCREREGFSTAWVDYGAPAQSLSIVNYITLGGVRAQLPVIAWPPTTFTNVGSSPNLVLQAYVVKDKYLDGTILEASDLDHPLFPEPLVGDALQEPSTWTLTEYDGGAIHLKKMDPVDILNRRKVASSLEQGIETLTKSFDVMRNQLDTLVKSLDDTHQRLVIVEKSVSTNQTELHEVQISLATARDEIARLDHKIPEAAKLAASLDHTNKRVTAIETSTTKLHGEVKALSAARGDLERLGVSVQDIQQQVSAVNTSLGSIVDRRLPTVESKSNDLDESLGHVQDQLSAARTAAGTTRDRVDRLNRGVLAVQATVDTLGASVGQDQDRLSVMEESLGQFRQRLDAAEKQSASDSAKLPQSPSARSASSPAQDDHIVTNEPLTSIRRQLSALNRRFPTLEAKMDRVEKSVLVMERKVPIVEDKVIRAEKLSEKTQDALAVLELASVTTGHDLASLGSRVAEVELKSSHLEEPWDDSEPPSPGVFPSQARLNSL